MVGWIKDKCQEKSGVRDGTALSTINHSFENIQSIGLDKHVYLDVILQLASAKQSFI